LFLDYEFEFVAGGVEFTGLVGEHSFLDVEFSYRVLELVAFAFDGLQLFAFDCELRHLTTQVLELSVAGLEYSLDPSHFGLVDAQVPNERFKAFEFALLFLNPAFLQRHRFLQLVVIVLRMPQVHRHLIEEFDRVLEVAVLQLEFAVALTPRLDIYTLQSQSVPVSLDLRLQECVIALIILVLSLDAFEIGKLRLQIVDLVAQFQRVLSKQRVDVLLALELGLQEWYLLQLQLQVHHDTPQLVQLGLLISHCLLGTLKLGSYTTIHDHPLQFIKVALIEQLALKREHLSLKIHCGFTATFQVPEKLVQLVLETVVIICNAFSVVKFALMMR
jgi:hypothetical protein